VPSVLWLGPFICGHEATYGKVPRTYFPLVVQSVSNLFVSGVLYFIDAVRGVGRFRRCWSEFNTAVPGRVRRGLCHRHRSVSASEYGHTRIWPLTADFSDDLVWVVSESHKKAACNLFGLRSGWVKFLGWWAGVTSQPESFLIQWSAWTWLWGRPSPWALSGYAAPESTGHPRWIASMFADSSTCPASVPPSN